MKEGSKLNGKKVKSWSRIKDENGRLALEEGKGYGRIILRIYII